MSRGVNIQGGAHLQNQNYLVTESQGRQEETHHPPHRFWRLFLNLLQFNSIQNIFIASYFTHIWPFGKVSESLLTSMWYVWFKFSSPKNTEGGIFSQDIVEHFEISF